MRTFFGREAMQTLWADRRGNFAVMTGAISIVLMLSAGFAVNIAQIVFTRANLLNALDSAITSTARDLTTGIIAPKDARTSVEAFLSANGGTGFASADKISLDSLTVNQVSKTVSAQASVDIALLFPFFSSGDTQHVGVASAAQYSDKDIEVAMMLDTTGSMAGQKIRDLQTAATNAVNTLLANQNPNNERVRVAIVPYAAAVNIGSALAGTTAYDEQNSSSPDLPPSFDKAQQVSLSPLIDTCTTERKLQNGAADTSDDGPGTVRQKSDGSHYYAKVNRDDRLGRSACPPAKIMPLTNDAKALNAEIATFRAGGTTAGNIGAQWTYYMLSPEWAGAVSDAGYGSGPGDYDPTGRKLGKIAILMTDGEFNTAFAGVRQGATTTNQPKMSSANAEAICSAMKDRGIEVFTIGFMLDEPGARTTLGDCASPDTSPTVKHFYDVADGAALNEAFQSIMRDIQKVVVTR